MMHNPFHSETYDIVTIVPTDPAAGANLSFPVPINTRIQPVHISFRIVADGTAANRIVRIGINDGTSTILCGLGTTLLTAAANRQYAFNVGISNDRELLGGGTFNEEWSSLNTQMIARFGDSIVTSIGNIQAGDQISEVVIRYKQWIMPA